MVAMTKGTFEGARQDQSNGEHPATHKAFEIKKSPLSVDTVCENESRTPKNKMNYDENISYDAEALKHSVPRLPTVSNFRCEALRQLFSGHA